jgi:hypothetical protein
MMSKTTAVASKPKGNTISIGCTGCPAIFIYAPQSNTPDVTALNIDGGGCPNVG